VALDIIKNKMSLERWCSNSFPPSESFFTSYLQFVVSTFLGREFQRELASNPFACATSRKTQSHEERLSERFGPASGRCARLFSKAVAFFIQANQLPHFARASRLEINAG
jgi:hypothetical protein